MSETCEIRKLTEADLPAYRMLRLEALASHPEAFGSAWEEETQLDESAFLAHMLPSPPGLRLGAFSRSTLIGTAGMFVAPRAKQRHKATVVGVYVDPAFRGLAVAHRLMTALLAEARQAGLSILQLSVTVGNEPARRIYRAIGFQSYGIERRALRIGDRFVDEELMALDLD